MKLATTTGDFDQYCTSYTEKIKNICDAGFKYIDLSLYAIKENDPLFYNNNWKEEVEKIKNFAEKNGVTFVQAHSPNTNFYKSEKDYAYAVEKTIRSIEICGMLGIKNTVVHSGYCPGLWDKNQWFYENKKFYEKLFSKAEEYNVNILCENTAKSNMNDGYFLISGSDMREFVKYVNHPLFHTCWDTGHANIEGSQYDEIKAIGDELYAVHINDNRGNTDEHLIPFFGTINMDEVMNGLIDINYKGVFTFEAGSVLKFKDNWLTPRRTYEKSAKLANPEIFMQNHMERLMYEIGEHILKSYNLYEE